MFFFFIHMLCFPQAWLLALLAAQRDNRLALLHLGHMHQQGLHGFPKDPDLAYAYYSNIAKQTTLDRQNPSPQQVIYVFYIAKYSKRNQSVLECRSWEETLIFVLMLYLKQYLLGFYMQFLLQANPISLACMFNVNLCPNLKSVQHQLDYLPGLPCNLPNNSKLAS